MALVGYSDSSSDDESSAPTKKPATPAPSHPKAPPKRKDNGEPHKIKISLPTPQADENDIQEPATKRAKTSDGGFNAMLPAPKRPKAALASSARGRGLGSGVNLKTGAAPGFSRGVPEPEPELEDIGEQDMLDTREVADGNDASTTADNLISEQIKKTGSAIRFKPLSVTRKPKKKPIAAMVAPITEAPPSAPPAVKPKISLFSTPVVDQEITSTTTTTTYEPIIHNTTSQAQDESSDLQDPIYTSEAQGSHQPIATQATSLSSIADSLNLSASQRRQLMGRKGAGLDYAKVLEFNTETEYAANEELRARGETVAFNPVRSVMGGKHSLQSLVNLVSNQKEALEDSFAKGKMNKKEAGAKYGW